MMAMIFSVVIITQFESDPTDLYNQGNEYYQQGRYAEAIAAYEQASKNVGSTKIYYNLGNSYFKKGMLGKAILNYRKANFLSPRDKDVMHNLDFARNYRVDKTSSITSPIMQALANIFRYLSFYEAQVVTTIFFVIAAAFASLFIIYRRSIYSCALVVASVLCMLFFISWQSWVADTAARHAVVTVSEVSALSGPGEDYKEILVIHDGAEVKLRETRGDYALIQLPGGVGGWVPTEAIEEIF